MEPAHLKELERLESTYWWHVAKRKLAITLLRRFAEPPGLLVEGGIGASGNLQEFQRLGYDVQGFDVLPEAISMAQQKGIETVGIHDLEKPWPVKEKARAVVLLDVLEHIADSVGALQNIKEILAPDGAVVLTVPAYPCLFNSWDEKLGHFRRYTTRMLRKEVAQSGLKIKWLGHWNSFTLPAAIAIRGFNRLFQRSTSTEFPRVSNTVNSMLLGCAGLERKLLMGLGVPMGLSICGVLTHDESQAN
jgi:SAM-dependent methyltransferase